MWAQENGAWRRKGTSPIRHRNTPSGSVTSCAGRSPGLRIPEPFGPAGRPAFPNRRHGQWQKGDLSGHGRGGGCASGLSLAHSLFTCHRQEPARNPCANHGPLSRDAHDRRHPRRRIPPPRKDGRHQGRPRPDDGNEDGREGPDHRPYRAGQGQILVRVRHDPALRGPWDALRRRAVHQGGVGDGRAHAARDPLQGRRPVRRGGAGLHLGNAGPCARQGGGGRRLGACETPDPRPRRSASSCSTRSTSRCATTISTWPRSWPSCATRSRR